jgi:hypothetical protein
MILAQARLEAVRLVLDPPMGPPAPEPSGFAAMGTLWLTLIVAGILVVVGAWAIHRWSRVPKAEQAFRLLALLTGVNRRDRRAIRALAAQQRLEPVAYLLSADAWPERSRMGEPRTLTALRDRVLRVRA